MSHVLAVDLGTTGVKVAVVGDDGRVHALAGERLRLLTTADGGVEQDPEEWWAAIGRCARSALAAGQVPPIDVDLVAVTSQYTSTTPIDAAGRPLGNTIMWMDTRGRRHHPCLVDRATAAWWIERHGFVPSGQDGIGHVAFIRREQPELYARTAAFVEPMDALVARLTGRITATQNTVFPMLCTDNRSRGTTVYDADMIERAGYDLDRLPELVPLGVPRGGLTSVAADHLGLRTGTVVADATIDSVTSAIGTGGVEPDRLGVVIGTTTVVATHVDARCQDMAHGLTAVPSPLPGRYLLVAENGIGGKALDVLVGLLDDTATPARHLDGAHSRLLRLAASSPPGSHGVIATPWLAGSMAPAFHRFTRATYANIGLETTRADLARAVVEGIALSTAWLVPYVEALAGTTEAALTLGGGVAASPLVGRILADCTGRPVRRLADPSAANARGAALLALVGAGRLLPGDLPDRLPIAEHHEPDPATTAMYAERLAHLTSLHAATAPWYAALNATEHRP